MTKTNVSVGAATVAGYTTTIGAGAAAVLAFVLGDRSEQTLGTIVAAAVAAIAFGITSLGRFLQAHAGIKVSAQAQDGTLVIHAADPSQIPADGDDSVHAETA